MATEGKESPLRREPDGAIVFAVRVVVRASRSAIAGEREGVLHVRIAAPPVDGAANKELVRLLARALGVPPRDIEIVSGASSRHKRVRVRGVELARVEGLWAET